MDDSAIVVWVADDDASMRWVLEQAFVEAGMQYRAFDSAEAVTHALKHARPTVLLTDIRMPGEDGLTLVEKAAVPVIVMTAHSDLDAAVAAYEGGAFDYLPKPFDLDAALNLVRRAARHAQPGREDDETQTPDTEIVGEAPAMQEVFRAIGRLKRSAVSVLITGETGTGKELVARALHRHSPRAAQPFVALNMAAIPAELIEAELFGHERGAFTGAQARRAGRFEQADGGTLFLDEIGDMPAAAQTRLLRVLSEGEFHRVGGDRSVKVDVRVIAATHQPLQTLVADGRFRDDLFHRLNVVQLQLAPLRERPSDIPLLLSHFMQAAATEMGVAPKTLGLDLLAWLTQLPWPGNVRELENLCRRLTVMAPGRMIAFDDLPDALQPDAMKRAGLQSPDWQQQLAAWLEDQLDKGATDIGTRTVAAVERILMDATLQHVEGQRGEAAKRLGWGRNTLTRKLKNRGH